MHFHDHFSANALAYKEFRPTYPRQLFAFLSTLVEHRNLAWDCATGNGQAAIDLVPYFERVIATDASEEQIKAAIPCSKIEYRVALAESSGLNEESVDLITVAQALHWFRFNEFYREAHRVSTKGTTVAFWGYALMQAEHEKVNQILHDFYWDILVAGKYWPPERRHLDEMYAHIPFPFMPIATPLFELETHWNLSQFFNYLNTWSAVQCYKRKHGRNPIDEWVLDKFMTSWLNPEIILRFSTPLILKVGRVG